ncbi:hypothetical protein Hanom_Chr03g00227921 [Helianthus anomalus]
MRHMDMYKGSAVSFYCGFSTNKDNQKMQLKNFRMKIATTLLSEASYIKELLRSSQRRRYMD